MCWDVSLFSLELCSQQRIPTALPSNPDYQHPSVKLDQNLPKIQAPVWPPTSLKHLNLIFLGTQPKNTEQSWEELFFFFFLPVFCFHNVKLSFQRRFFCPFSWSQVTGSSCGFVGREHWGALVGPIDLARPRNEQELN